MAAPGTSAIVDVTNFDFNQAAWHCDQLERGKVLFFSHVPRIAKQCGFDRVYLSNQSPFRHADCVGTGR